MTSDRRLVAVEWIDAIGALDLTPGEHLLPPTVTTVGFIYEHNENYITVASEIVEDDDELRHVTTIPRAIVVREIELAPRYKDSPG
jgi:hypothetical protein